jgi:predicted small secreted protein
MKRKLSVLIVVLACTVFTACTSLRTILDTQSGSASVAQPALVPNDLLTITTRDGTQTQITLTRTAPEFIEGNQENGAQARHFDLSEVIKIERREFDGLKTAFLVIAIAIGVYTILKATAEASLAANL